MKTTKVILFIAAFLLGPVALAGTSVNGVTIRSIATGWGGEGIYITINEAVPAVEGCQDPRYVLLPDAPLFKENVSFALSAFHSQSKVNIYVIGCFGPPLNIHKISAVSLWK